MVQQRLEAYHLGTAHQCFFHLDSVIDSVLKIGRFAGLGTEGLLVGKVETGLYKDPLWHHFCFGHSAGEKR